MFLHLPDRRFFQKSLLGKWENRGIVSIYLCFQKSKPISYDESNYMGNYPGMVGQDAPKEREKECCEQ
jgi:hypothetical protein